jgi:ADP-ribose pyrophosphatase YjhB (NUDIX family)
VTREYPDYPRLGVGAIVLHQGRVLLVKRGQAPALGLWSVPGGLVDVGETTVDAARREVEEECGLKVRVAGLVGVLDRVTRDADGRVRYHWVLVDYLAFPETNDTITAGSDAAEVRWVTIDEVERLPITEGLADMIRRAVVLSGGGGA